jgi:hypothetical protein
VNLILATMDVTVRRRDGAVAMTVQGLAKYARKN